MTEDIRVLSFFAGIGGIELGLEWSGAGGGPKGWGGPLRRRPRSAFRTVGQVELEPYALRVLGARWPGVPRLGDVTAMAAADLPTADLWCGGFPCQDISTAGKGAGIRGSRSGLFFDWMRMAAEARPPMVLMENVGALLFRGLDAVLAELASMGYDAEWECVPAGSLGAPHRRDRVFVLALSPESPVRPGRWAGPGRTGLVRWLMERNAAGVWAGDPGLPRLVPRTKVVEDRLERLGNAVVPQAAEALGAMLLRPAAEPSMGVPFARWYPDGGWTAARGFSGMAGEFGGPWPRSGTMEEGVARARRPCLCPLRQAAGGQWSTPCGMDRAQQDLDVWEERRKRKAEEGINLQRPLNVAVQQEGYLWPTPTGLTGIRMPSRPTEKLLSGERSHGWDLDTVILDDASADPARAWPTPVGHWRGLKKGRTGFDGRMAERIWPTPRGADSGGPQWSNQSDMEASGFSSMLSSEALAEGAGWYPTPCGADGPMPGGFAHKTVESVESSKYHKGLTTGQRVDAAGPDGDLPSMADWRLNPEWVEWLMGFPRGWTEA